MARLDDPGKRRPWRSRNPLTRCRVLGRPRGRRSGRGGPPLGGLGTLTGVGSPARWRRTSLRASRRSVLHPTPRSPADERGSDVVATYAEVAELPAVVAGRTRFVAGEEPPWVAVAAQE